MKPIVLFYIEYSGPPPVLVHVDPSKPLENLVSKRLPPIYRNEVLPPKQKPPLPPDNNKDVSPNNGNVGPPPNEPAPVMNKPAKVDRQGNLILGEENDNFEDLERPVHDSGDSKDLLVQLQESKVNVYVC